MTRLCYCFKTLQTSRLFILCFITPSGVLLTMVCITLSTFSLATQNSKPFFFHVLRFLTVLLSQHLRFSTFLIIVERTMATIFLDKYSIYSSNTKVFIFSIILSLIIQLPCSLPAFACGFRISSC